MQRLHHLTAERALKAAGGSIEVLLIPGDDQWNAELDMNPEPVNALDAALSSAVGGARRAASVLNALGALLIAAALLIAGGVIWFGLPIVALVPAVVLSAAGSFLLISARQRRIS
ncbi:MAG: hypothetical protein ACYDAL_15905 [Candidatus Dormibacteraceae bacterium]